MAMESILIGTNTSETVLVAFIAGNFIFEVSVGKGMGNSGEYVAKGWIFLLQAPARNIPNIPSKNQFAIGCIKKSFVFFIS